MSQDHFLNPWAIIAMAEVEPGMRVADFGAGRMGHLSFSLARTVGEDGAVYAVDIHPDALSMLRGHRALRAMNHLHVIRGDIERYEGVRGIDPHSLDQIFIVNTLWTIRSSLLHVMAEARRLLKATGKLVVVEWDAKTTHPIAPNPVLRLPVSVLDEVFVRGGCIPCAQFSASQHHWGRVYRH